jgi:hypothetical protein
MPRIAIIFAGPFQSQLREFGHFVTFPRKPADLATVEFPDPPFFPARTHWRHPGGTRPGPGGCHVPPPEFPAVAAQTL